ncbi:MAG: glycosyltransferase, partial [Lachnospiraceae bacterium]|nr:glycosyltransferase [Lachnospiraceae bacterium]
SYDILLKYEKEGSDRIIVINCDTNSGAGGARNIGLDMATGEYIGFVDSDDFVQKDMFECLLKKAVSRNYDIVDSPFYITKSDSLRPPIDDSLCDRTLSPGQRELLILSDGYIFSKLFKASVLKENSIRFRPHVKLEDADFLLKAVLHSDLFGNIHEPKYVYDNAGDEDTWSVKKAASKEFDHILSLLEEYGNILKTDEAAALCQTAIKAAILHFYRAGIACCLSDTNSEVSSEMSRADLIRLIKLKNAKNRIFLKGYDNPYFQEVADEVTIKLMKQIDELKM